jgi:hypothetical protein
MSTLYAFIKLSKNKEVTSKHLLQQVLQSFMAGFIEEQRLNQFKSPYLGRFQTPQQNRFFREILVWEISEEL